MLKYYLLQVLKAQSVIGLSTSTLTILNIVLTYLKTYLENPLAFLAVCFWYNEEFETVLHDKVFKLNEFSMR